MIKILAIDDIVDNLIVLNALLKRLLPNSKVITALSGREGIELAISELPDTILLDLQMPEMDGYEVCEELKRIESTKHIPIIILTALHKDTDSKIRAMEKGADAFLSKPIDKGELMAQINAMLRIKNAEDLLRNENKHLENLVDKRTKELFESEKKYRSFFEDDLSCDFISMPNGQLIGCNKAFISLFEFQNKQEALLHSIVDLYIDIDDRTRLVSELMTAKILINYPLKMKKLDGTPLRVLENARAIFDENNQLREIRGYIIDVTEQYNTEQALLKESKINRIIAELSKVMLSIDLSVSKIARIIYNAVLDLCNSPEGFVSVIDKNSYENNLLIYSDLFNESTKIFPAYYKASEVYYEGIIGRCLNTKTGFYSNQTKNYPSSDIMDGRIVRFLSVPVIANNTLIGQIAVANSQRNYNEKDLEILERLANLFTLAVSRKQTDIELIAAKQKAEESDRLKSSFLANLSHEIRTPLNGIMGFSQLLKRSDLSQDKLSQFTDIILASSNQLLEIISDILDISLIDTRMIKINKNRFNVNRLMVDVYEHHRQKFNEKSEIEFVLNNEHSMEDNYIFTDEIRLRQIFNNLLSNALKFTHKGVVEIGYKVQENGDILFFVKDTGIGISNEKLDIIFERFRQEDETHTRVYGGTGIGLTIAKGLVEIFGGKIWVVSQKNKGSEFYFSLPSETLVKVEVPQISKNLKGAHILIVDDTPDICEYLNEVLTDEGVITYFAHNGVDAVEKVRVLLQLDAILMDIQMPQMNGYEATAKIREFNQRVAIIAQTAYGLTTKASELNKKGFNDFIPKPIDSEELIEVLAKNIKRK